MKGQFSPKFAKLPQVLQDEIIARAKEVGAYKAANENAGRANMHPQTLYEKLKKLVVKKKVEGWGAEFLPESSVYKNGGNKADNFEYGRNSKSSEKDLNREEKEFLRKLGTGELTFEETSRFVAVRVFERMLKNPDKWQYLDFFRTELIKVKREEAQIKDAWAKELIGRMFSGKLPPKTCPNCGHNFMETKVIEGKVIEDEPRRITPSV